MAERPPNLRPHQAKAGIPYEIRTRVAAVKGQCPRPLDERDAEEPQSVAG